MKVSPAARQAELRRRSAARELSRTAAGCAARAACRVVVVPPFGGSFSSGFGRGFCRVLGGGCLAEHGGGERPTAAVRSKQRCRGCSGWARMTSASREHGRGRSERGRRKHVFPLPRVMAAKTAAPQGKAGFLVLKDCLSSPIGATVEVGSPYCSFTFRSGTLLLLWPCSFSSRCILSSRCSLAFAVPSQSAAVSRGRYFLARP